MISPETVLAWQSAPEGMPARPAAGLAALFTCPHPADGPGRPA
jgi:hypothetical protein